MDQYLTKEKTTAKLLQEFRLVHPEGSPGVLQIRRKYYCFTYFISRVLGEKSRRQTYEGGLKRFRPSLQPTRNSGQAAVG